MKRVTLFLFVLFLSMNVYAYDNINVHQLINVNAALQSSGFTSTMKSLGFKGRTPNEIIELNVLKGKKIKNWFEDGGKFEDETVCRSKFHFHDPTKSFDHAGLDNALVDTGCSDFRHRSSLIWAQDIDNLWSWQKARQYYYQALTSSDKNTREQSFGYTFKALGQVMHLLADSSVPEHTRNDIHVFPLFDNRDKAFPQTGRWTYETWCKYNVSALHGTSEAIDYSITNNSLSPGLVPITNFWDTTPFPGYNLNPVGLAEYSNLNFLSKDTIFKDYTYPQEPRSFLLEPLTAEDEKTDYRVYFRGTTSDGQIINHLASTGYLWSELSEVIRDDIDDSRFNLDDGCYRDYASVLIPKAISYSAALLNYFFRGELQVTAAPILYRNAIHYLRVKVRNITPTQETMKGGHFMLTYQYTKTTPGGSQDVLGLGWAKEDRPEADNTELKYAGDQDNPDEMVIDFLLPDPIPWENYQSAKFTLAFRGNLGKYVGQTFEIYEKDAVIGKSLTLGEVKLKEEWDNGLNGNYTWAHTGFNLFGQDPENGITSNIIEGESLVKDNTRYVGFKTARVNESFLSTSYDNGQFKGNLPIKITPNTHIVFKIDEMWIDERTPAPPGYTNDWQYLMLTFSNGLGIQYSTQGQGLYFGPNVAYFEFNPNLIIVDNIYDLFKIWDITIPPGDLYLNGISFVQQLFVLDEPSTVRHHQHMKIDGIWIIEGKRQ